MKTTIKTELLKTLLTQASKIATNNKMLPLTCMTCIEIKGKKIQLLTTNGSDYMYTIGDTDSENFYAVVDNDVFTKLVNRTTTEDMTFEVEQQHMIVTGNGKYTLELPVDENGELIKYPNPLERASEPAEFEFLGEISKEDVEVILKTNKANLSTSLAEPCYTGYYVSDKVLTSDRSVICSTNADILKTPVLFNADVINALTIGAVKIMKIADKENDLFLSGDNYGIFTHAMADIENYNADAIKSLVDTELQYKCNISKTELLNVLDRLSLFITPFDKNCIVLTFADNKFTLENQALNSTETINIVCDNAFTCNVDVEIFKKQVNAMNDNVFELQYSSDMFIKLVTEKVTEIIPLLVE